MSKLPIVAIVGRANVGKSSLFNRIVASRDAIVADEPGTTRDSISRKVHHKSSHFWLVDTAGLKSPDDDFEFTIQEQITQAADSADILLVVVEAHVPFTEEDRRVAKLALKTQKPCFLVVNKMDKAAKGSDTDFRRLGITEIFQASATHNRGVEEILDKLTDTLPKRKDTEASALSISFIGRPNVGKSSLFNALAKKQQAVVADVAGTTRDVNKLEIRWHSKTVSILDTAGIRRSGKIGRGIERFSVIRALAAIEDSDVCCFVMDVNEYNTKLDQKIAGMISDAGKGLIVVVSKWDSIEKDAYTRDAIAPEISREFPFIYWAPLIFTSATEDQNVNKLFELAEQIRKNRKTEISTPILNKWLQKCVQHHPPAGLKNTRPKLQYITQIGTDGPRFRIFGKDTNYLHWSYKRYLEREIRSLANFEGTPIIFEFSDANAPK